jgi:hypothetical protein
MLIRRDTGPDDLPAKRLAHVRETDGKLCLGAAITLNFAIGYVSVR